MAHQYKIDRATSLNGVVMIIGSVNTIPPSKPVQVIVETDLATLQTASTSGGLAAVEAVVAPLMLAAAVLNGLPNPNQPIDLKQTILAVQKFVL